jgi:hypothetical protein
LFICEATHIGDVISNEERNLLFRGGKKKQISLFVRNDIVFFLSDSKIQHGNTMDIVKRITAMLLRPASEWDAIAHDAPGVGTMLRNYLLPLSLLAPLATMAGMLLLDTRWNAEYGYSQLRDRALVIAVATFAFEIASVYLLAVVFYFLARTEGRHPTFLVALQVAVFGSIPVLLSGVALVIPFGVIVTLMALIYAFYLCYLGAQRLIGIREADSTMFIGVAMFCMMVLSTLLGAVASALGIV